MRRGLIEKSLVLTATFFFILVLAVPALAVPAYPGLKELRQPDGTAFWARQWGDERVHGWETADGYTIVKDKNGYWYFARKRGNGSLASSGIRADRPDLLPEGYPKHLRPGKAEPRTQSTGKTVTLVGMVVFSKVEGPHYELLVPDEVCTLGGPVPSKCVPTWKHYVLLGDAKLRPGWLYLVRGRLSDVPNVWMMPAVHAELAVPLLPVLWLVKFLRLAGCAVAGYAAFPPGSHARWA